MTNEELEKAVSDLLHVGRLVEARDAIERVLEERTSPSETYAFVLDIYHTRLPMLPRVTKLTPPRLRALRERTKKLSTPAHWDQYFSRVARSPFLTGTKPGVTWKASFDWLLKPANMTKVVEGNYDPPRTGGLTESDEAAFRMSQPFTPDPYLAGIMARVKT